MERTLKPTAREIEAFILRSFPTEDGQPVIFVEEVSERRARLRIPARAGQLRPGQTMSGPIQMTLADTASWTLILHNLGLGFAASVTSSLNINFLARPEPADLIAEAGLLKLGKRLCVAEVRVYSAGRPEPVAHATVTYALVGGERPSAP